jgi:hypothetical protein
MAWLPAQLLYVAAQFASADPAKQALTAIRVRPAGKGGTGIIIDSTDSHRAFRVKCPDSTWCCDGATLINAKSFKKRINRGRFAAIDDAGSDIARILGGKGAGLEHLLSVPCQAKKNFTDSKELFHASDYPNLDQLWPDKFTNEPKGVVGFNAALLKDFLVQVERYSCNGTVKMQCNAPHNPLYFTAEIDDKSSDLENVVMEFMLMPVQFR